VTGRTVPSPPTESPGIYQTSALFNAQVRDLNNFTLGVPVFSGYASTTQAIPNSAYTSFTLDTEEFDSDGGHSTVTNTSRYVAQVPGTYVVLGSSAWGASSSGYRRTRITLNGNAIRGLSTGFDQNQVVTSAGIAMAVVAMNGTTDYVEVQGAHNATSLSTVSASDFCCAMRVYWLCR
jgi:hypothetical protein